MSIWERLEKFEKIKSQIVQSGGNIYKNTLVFVLLESIHPRYSRNVRSVTQFIKTLTYKQVFEELLETHKFSSLNQQPDSTTEEANLIYSKTNKH